MTNEEIIEDTYYKAHKKGFAGEMINEVLKLSEILTDKTRCEIVQMAYKNVKKYKKNELYLNSDIFITDEKKIKKPY